MPSQHWNRPKDQKFVALQHCENGGSAAEAAPSSLLKKHVNRHQRLLLRSSLAAIIRPKSITRDQQTVNYHEQPLLSLIVALLQRSITQSSMKYHKSETDGFRAGTEVSHQNSRHSDSQES